jgi:hypothetical protein
MLHDIAPLLETYIVRLVQLNTALANDLMTSFCKIAPATQQTTTQKVELLAILAAGGIIGIQMGRTLVSIAVFYVATSALVAWRKKKGADTA